MKTFFVTGIGTDVGKTIVSAILVEALEADYWKPIQAGDLHHTDRDKVQQLVSNSKSKFHKSTFELKTPMSPHAAAKIDGITIEKSAIKAPKTSNNLIIEGAGGLLVPINDKQTILDIIPNNADVIVVSRHYLGSINHTLLTLKVLEESNHNVSLIFNGDEHASTEHIIKKMSNVKVIGRINNEPYFDRNVIKEYAELLKEAL